MFAVRNSNKTTRWKSQTICFEKFTPTVLENLKKNSILSLINQCIPFLHQNHHGITNCSSLTQTYCNTYKGFNPCSECFLAHHWQWLLTMAYFNNNKKNPAYYTAPRSVILLALMSRGSMPSTVLAGTGPGRCWP